MNLADLNLSNSGEDYAIVVADSGLKVELLEFVTPM